jgi:hypothetical protein
MFGMKQGSAFSPPTDTPTAAARSRTCRGEGAGSAVEHREQEGRVASWREQQPKWLKHPANRQSAERITAFQGVTSCAGQTSSAEGCKPSQVRHSRRRTPVGAAPLGRTMPLAGAASRTSQRRSASGPRRGAARGRRAGREGLRGRQCGIGKSGFKHGEGMAEAREMSGSWALPGQVLRAAAWVGPAPSAGHTCRPSQVNGTHLAELQDGAVAVALVCVVVA